MPVPMDSNSWISSPETVEYFLKMQSGSHPWILMSRIIVTCTPSVLFLAPLFKFALCLIHHWWLPTDTLAIKPLAPGTGIWPFFWRGGFCPEIDILGNLQPWSHECHIIRCPTQDPPRDIHCLMIALFFDSSGSQHPLRKVAMTWPDVPSFTQLLCM